ncbi:hypothetical protein [Clostridium tagluense]|uniref:hypothetical protein n=1 Tax=Clostridium tagluense TaxID=360422 RepID=UPI001C6EAF92|nr:hypothetical protein [Clostridium tagluense]MBW9159519.1 hypothetical protein [Clostridium tagluense]WLC68518.1 hypothetical protein KTC93_25735 [Clostridium tagluense]
MKKLSKRTYILIAICITIIIYFIGIYNYRKPITIHKTFSNVIVLNTGTKNIVKTEINAKLYRGIYMGSIMDISLHFTNRIEGKIIIDGKEYSFDGFNRESNLINIIGTVYEDNQNSSPVFWFKMNDLNSIKLTCFVL